MNARLTIVVVLTACGGNASGSTSGSRAVDAGGVALAKKQPPALADVSTLPTSNLDRVSIVNEVAACTTLTPKHVVVVGNVEVGTFALTSIKSRADCGCMSAEMAYSVIQKYETREDEKVHIEERERVYGVVAARDDDQELSLVISTDRRARGDTPLTLKLRCKPPD
jgi:hypothetical protein